MLSSHNQRKISDTISVIFNAGVSGYTAVFNAQQLRRKTEIFPVKARWTNIFQAKCFTSIIFQIDSLNYVDGNRTNMLVLNKVELKVSIDAIDCFQTFKSKYLSFEDWRLVNFQVSYSQALGTHFSRLLRHAWATVGLFFNPGDHTGKIIYTY